MLGKQNRNTCGIRSAEMGQDSSGAQVRTVWVQDTFAGSVYAPLVVLLQTQNK